MHQLAKVLNEEQLTEIRRRIDGAEFVDGVLTGGEYGKRVKNNLQIKPSDEIRATVIPILHEAIHKHPEFFPFARPRRITFNINRYETGMSFGNHNDAGLTGSYPDNVVRTDLSMTLFLSPPDSYDGGELVMVSQYGEVPVKLSAGDAILYPSGMLHRVEPITRGVRLGAFAWIQSMIRDEHKRLMLFQLDRLRHELARDKAKGSYITGVSNTFNNLLRMWAED